MTIELDLADDNAAQRRYNPLISRTYICETCEEPISKPGIMSGDDCPRWSCDGGPVLSEQRKRAADRLLDGPSETCQRLGRYARGEAWSLSTEDFLQPLKATEGDIVLRQSVESGALWTWWAGSPLGNDYFRCISALPHWHDHKVVGRYSAAPSRLADRFDDHLPRPVHIDNVPQAIREVMVTDSPYEDRGLLASTE